MWRRVLALASIPAALFAIVALAPAATAPVTSNFTTGTDGWGAYQASVGTFNVGGNGFLRACRTSGTFFTINDEPDRVLVGSGNAFDDYVVRGYFIGGDAGGNATWKLREKTPAGATVRDLTGDSPAARTTPGMPGEIAESFPAPTAGWTPGNYLEARLSIYGFDAPYNCMDADWISREWGPSNPPPPPENQPPVANFTFSPQAPVAPATVDFTATSTDPDDSAGLLSHEWDLDGDNAYDDGTGSAIEGFYESPGDVTVGVRTTDPDGAFDVERKVITISDPNPPPPPPPPPGEGTFDNPFAGSDLRTPIGTRPVHSNSASLTASIIGAARNVNSGRGPTWFGSGERRTLGTTGPLYTFYGSGTSHQARADSCPQGSGLPDDTYGVYDETTDVVVRGWGGDSVPLQRDCTARTVRGSTIGVADINGEGLPFKGNGTAWGRMSFEGVVGGDDWAVRDIDHGIKVALGNDRLNRNAWVWPAISSESKASLGPVPMGTNVCHVMSKAFIDSEQARLGVTGDTGQFSDMFFDATACGDFDGDGKTGFGLYMGDGTGNGGFNVYASDDDLPNTIDVRLAMRLGGRDNGSAWNDSNWRTLIAPPRVN